MDVGIKLLRVMWECLCMHSKTRPLAYTHVGRAWERGYLIPSWLFFLAVVMLYSYSLFNNVFLQIHISSLCEYTFSMDRL